MAESTRSRRSRRGRQVVSAATFATFALVGAFLVSAVAGVLGDDPSAPAASRSASRTLAPGETVRVEVLNGAGSAGLARDVTNRLRSDGFDVVFFGNAARFDHSRSVVLDRSGVPARARAVAAALGIDSVAIAHDPTLLLDVSVVLGSDWLPAPRSRSPLLERVRDLTLRPRPSP